MPVDLFQSRRNYNEFCRWWSRDERDENIPSELIIRRDASGTFWAKEISPESAQDTPVGNVFMFEKTSTTIKSPDNLNGIKSNDIVQYQDELWFVETVQKSKAKLQNTQFAKDKNCSHFWYIELRK